jgi:hypothetical protein
MDKITKARAAQRKALEAYKADAERMAADLVIQYGVTLEVARQVIQETVARTEAALAINEEN